jgi:creatinine amidohydrolase
MNENKHLITLMGYEYETKKFNKVILAIGSTEYHGEHLPYGTDTLVAEYLANETAKRCKGTLVLPTLNIGMSSHYSSFPIAISLSTETLMQVLKDVFDSLRKHQLNRLLIINGHDGNIPAIEASTREYRVIHPEFKIAVLEAWWVAAGRLVPEGTFEIWDGLGHGGEGETSMMLYVNPDLVDISRAKGIVPDLPSYIEVKWTFDELTPYGATGDPTKGTQEKGRLMGEALVNILVEFIEFMDSRDWEISYNK